MRDKRREERVPAGDWADRERRRRSHILQYHISLAIRVLVIFLAGVLCGSLMTGMALKADSDTVPVSAGSQTPEKVAAAGEAELAKASRVVYTVVVDAGHGGKDPGSLEAAEDEKEINLEMALKLKQILEKRGISVIMTRTADTSVALSERADIANASEADLFISIHQNSYKSSQINGIEFWYNGTKTKGGEESITLADCLNEAVAADSAIKSRGTVSNKDLQVLRTTEIPAVLIEAGYLTNPTEQRRLLSDDYQEKLMGYIADGIEAFLDSSSHMLN